MYAYDRAAIRDLLNKQGQTVSDLFRALVRRGYEGGRGPIADCVSGKIVPDADRIALIATVLNVPPASFFFGGPIGVRVAPPAITEPDTAPDAEPDAVPADEVAPDDF